MSASPISSATRIDAIFRNHPIIPVITIENAADAVSLARALVAGGLHALEITLRTAAAAEAVGAVVAEVPEAIVGVGTVLNTSDLSRAAALGARFALSPGATPDLLAAAATGELPFVPGVATASELMAALAQGFSTVKFFPAVSSGGIAALRALRGPFPQARFCPTGGIGEINFVEWLAEPNVVAIGGSWLAPSDAIRNGDWATITRIARSAVDRLAALTAKP
jgi:2-dehydro-3-deoxyphosphogluconate aldolase/(4S)-4-hydroxy-2-oxoglutarate aldolase